MDAQLIEQPERSDTLRVRGNRITIVAVLEDVAPLCPRHAFPAYFIADLDPSRRRPGGREPFGRRRICMHLTQREHQHQTETCFECSSCSDFHPIGS